MLQTCTCPKTTRRDLYFHDTDRNQPQKLQTCAMKNKRVHNSYLWKVAIIFVELDHSSKILPIIFKEDVYFYQKLNIEMKAKHKHA
jgi:hypothetical protein